MNYSYIETTFPHFKYTNVYDTKIYNDIILKSPETNSKSTGLEISSSSSPANPIRENSDFVNFDTLKYRRGITTDNVITNERSDSYIPYNHYNTDFKIIDKSKALSIQNSNNYRLQDTNKIQTNSLKHSLLDTSIESFKGHSIQKKESSNLKFYNTPVPVPVPVPTNETILNKENDTYVERLEGENENEHTKYVNHVLECSICKEIVLKQLNIESNRLFKEEILEILSYILFGFFILMLLER
jgi:hypothetical protein